MSINVSPTYGIRLHVIVSKPEVLALKTKAERDDWLNSNVVAWFNETNIIYKTAGVRFDLNISNDVEFDASIESQDPPKNPSGGPDPLQKRALQYRGRLVVFVRGHGGNAGSGAEYFHLQAPGYGTTAHEMGHYFLLNHTFVEGRTLRDLPPVILNAVESNPFGKQSLAQIAAAGPFGSTIWVDYVESIGSAAISRYMDGDSLANNGGGFMSVEDTPASIKDWPAEYDISHKCEPGYALPVEVTFGGGYTHTYHFRADMTNVMSYGGCSPAYFSEQQIAIIRYALEYGLRNHLLGPALEWNSWTQVQGGGTTDAGPAAAALGDRLYLFAKGIQGNGLYVNSARDGQSFGQWSEVEGGATTDAAPAAAALGDRLYLFAKGIQGNGLYVNSARDGQPFGQWSEVEGGATTDAAPAAAALGDRLYVVAKGIEGQGAYINSARGGQPFGQWSEVQGGGKTNAALAMAAFSNKLLIFAKGIVGDYIYSNAAFQGQPFGAWGEVRGGLSTNVAVAAAGFKNRLYVIAAAKNGRLYFNTGLDGAPFCGWDEIPGNRTTDAAPAMAVLGERIYVVAKGVGDKALYINSARLV